MTKDETTNIKVSVILPVYNVEPYMGRCIESLQMQTLQELEFIFVDDCSTDKSMAAVEAWAAQDERVRVLRNTENIGAGLSRNRGIDAAQGEYLSFIDPDDYISSDFYELLYIVATSDGKHDIAKGCFRSVDGVTNSIGPRQTAQNDRIRKHALDGIPLFRGFTYEHQTALYSAPLFKDSSVRYGKSRKDQDTTFQLAACLKAKDIVLEEHAIYYYVQRDGSAIHTFTPRHFFDELDSFEEKVTILKRRGIDEDACRYLAVKLRVYLNNYEKACEGHPELRDMSPSFYQRIDSILASTEQSKKIKSLAQKQQWGSAVRDCLAALRKRLRWLVSRCSI